MIEKMKMVHIVTTRSRKGEMLRALRNLGLMHISEKKRAGKAASERFARLSRTIQTLEDYTPKKFTDPVMLTTEEFADLYKQVLDAIDRKAKLTQSISEANSELERIQLWGDFSPQELKRLKAEGIDLHFYRLGSAETEAIASDESIRFIRLRPIDKMDTVAVLGALPPSISANEFPIPEKSAEQLKAFIADSSAEIADCEETLKKAALYRQNFNQQLIRLQNEETFSEVDETVQGDEELIWLSGYVPDMDMPTFKQAAMKNNWAWAASDVADDDENVPTKVCYNKVSRFIKPVFDVLGILPGYREQDISLWFFLFFILFFAMIIGDAGYGLLILIVTIVFTAETKKLGDVQFLLFVLSIGTIVWGAVTGTWFGMESAMKVPFLKALVIPSFANYPEYFGLTAQAQQNAIMKFSFSIGAIQMLLGSLLSVKKKISEKDLSFVADIGWMIAVAAMYLLSLYLVIGENISVVPIFTAIGVAFVLVILFGGMSPDKSFAAGLKSGLADTFTVFLDTISCFGNVMSYIRLFAVGMAGLAIAQSFNNIAAGFSGPLIILGAVVVLIGHALNIVMAILSVVVHGVRLNVLEFSGQAGMEWTGIAYEPFEESTSIKS